MLERLRQRACEAGVEAARHGQLRQHWPASKYTGEGEAEAHLVAAAYSTPLATRTGPCRLRWSSKNRQWQVLSSTAHARQNTEVVR